MNDEQTQPLSDLERVINDIIAKALDEDLGLAGDITSEAIFPEDMEVVAQIIAKESGVIAGLFMAAAVFTAVDINTSFVPLVEDGAAVKPGDVIAQVKGNIIAVLSGERTALNFLAHMSGVATATRAFVERTESYGVAIKDTRKTLPGLRVFEKYAVQAGGGRHHRFGLFDGVLIKDNHIKLAGGITNAVEQARDRLQADMPIEIECATLDEVAHAVEAGVDVIMLDNMDIDMIKDAVRVISGEVQIEVSGGVNMDNVEEIAEAGIDFISIGSITQSAKALDLSMLIP